MSSINPADCIIGSKLQGVCRGNRPRSPKTDIIILPRYNNRKCVLEGFATCEIIDKVKKLSAKDYLECLRIIRENGYSPKESINFEIKGNEISCEFETQLKKGLIFKGIIALGILVRSFSKGGLYGASETYMGTPKFRLK